MERNNLIIIILVVIILIMATALVTYIIVGNQQQDIKTVNNTTNTTNTTATAEKVNQETEKSVYAYKSDGTPMYSKAEVDNYVKNKYGAVNYHIQDNGYINLDDAGYTDDGAKVKGGLVNKNGTIYEREFYENYIMGK